MDVKNLNIKNRVFSLPTKVVNVFDFIPEKLDIQKKGDDEIGIYYIDHDLGPFYLVIDDLKGYFEKNNGSMYLTLVSNYEHDKYVNIWEKIKTQLMKLLMINVVNLVKIMG